jgi:hypothetical protein
MAGKDGSTQHMAPMAAEETSGEQPRQSQQPVSEEKRDPARSEGSPERQSTLECRSAMDAQPPSHEPKAPRGMLDRSLQAQLGRQLRSIFSDVANEPVPERFIKLLEALEAKEKRR